VAIRPPKHSSQGFTLIEMVVILGIVGIIAGFAIPSLLTLNKPLRDGALAFKGHLGLIRSKAISSNQAYRIRPRYPTTSEYIGDKNIVPHPVRNFIVEYANNCQVKTYGAGLLKYDGTKPVGNPAFPNGTPDGWNMASQFDLDLPPEVGVVSSSANGTSTPLRTEASGTTDVVYPAANPTLSTTTVTTESYLDWSICFDNRGLVTQPVSFTLKDFKDNHRAKIALFDISQVGGVDIYTYDTSNNLIVDPNNPSQPSF
jgi:prepilin-type N-terminal cleavage/methylation domain-containing protein